jgi:hypothetical protein
LQSLLGAVSAVGVRRFAEILEDGRVAVEKKKEALSAPTVLCRANVPNTPPQTWRKVAAKFGANIGKSAAAAAESDFQVRVRALTV